MTSFFGASSVVKTKTATKKKVTFGHDKKNYTMCKKQKLNRSIPKDEVLVNAVDTKKHGHQQFDFFFFFLKVVGRPSKIFLVSLNFEEQRHNAKCTSWKCDRDGTISSRCDVSPARASHGLRTHNYS